MVIFQRQQSTIKLQPAWETETLQAATDLIRKLNMALNINNFQLGLKFAWQYSPVIQISYQIL